MSTVNLSDLLNNNYQGPSGFTGSIGFTGSVGFTGSRGNVGFTGSQGTGFTGSRGNVGFTGSIGFTGSQGVTGSDANLQVVNHGSNASTARPSGFDYIIWIGEVEPNNAVNDDLWVNTDI